MSFLIGEFILLNAIAGGCWVGGNVAKIWCHFDMWFSLVTRRIKADNILILQFETPAYNYCVD